jgi:hypothetical protein
MAFIIEVQHILRNKSYQVGTKFAHLGYMNIVFATSNEAQKYFNIYTPYTVNISTMNGVWTVPLSYKNDICRYHILPYNDEFLSVPPFEYKDLPRTKTRFNSNGDIIDVNISYYKSYINSHINNDFL